MNKFLFNKSVNLFCFFVLTLIGTCVLQARPDSKLAPAELVAKHLDSIGPAADRARVHGTQIKGTCVLIAKMGGSGQSEGQVLMASLGRQNLIKLAFDSEDASTWFKFDGSKTVVSQFRPGRRTPLEQFFAAYDVILKEGLVGGTLSESWPLLAVQEKNPKLEYSGVRKLGSQEFHVLKYTPRKGSDLKITLFFELETFRHVRTEYEQTIYVTDQQRITGGGGQLPSTSGARATNARINAFEEFSDFKPERGLNLPHTYKFELSIQSEVKPALIDWVFNLVDFNFNTPLDPSEFTFSSGTSKGKPD
jgi:hypothetical protein